MITEIKIIDNTKTPKHYLPDLSTFTDGNVYTFKPGVNIIIGKNGSGKSTLMELIYTYGLCQEGMMSEMPRNLLSLSQFWKSYDEEFLGGVDIKADYRGTIFRYLPKTELQKLGSDSILGSLENISTYMSKSSTGESILGGLGMLFKKMFSEETNLRFPLQELSEKANNSNEVWSKRLNELLEYYKRNKIEISKNDYEFTVLLDEPDRNLDIYNLKSIYDILAYRKDQVQIIAVIHNPLLIYKLSGYKNINFIEMTPGYLGDIINFVENEKL